MISQLHVTHQLGSQEPLSLICDSKGMFLGSAQGCCIGKNGSGEKKGNGCYLFSAISRIAHDEHSAVASGLHAYVSLQQTSTWYLFSLSVAPEY